MAESMRAAVLYAPLDLRIETRPVPRPGDLDVLVAIRAVGVCGSDVHYWQSGRIGDFVVRDPMVLGHEAAGEVVEIGRNVVGLSVGDRVALEPGVPCRRCEWCKSGRYNLCPDVVFMATPPVDGAFCDYVVHPADFAYRLPASVSYEEGALFEPLSVGIHAVRRAGVGPGSSVMICGAGPIGLTALLAARAAGATTIVVTDLVSTRLELARSLGATRTIDVTSGDTVAEALDETSGIGVDAAIECTGAAPAQESGLLALKRGGVLVTVGLGGDRLNLPSSAIGSKELDIRGVFRYANTYAAATALVGTGAVNLMPLISHHFDLKHAEAALAMAHGRAPGVVKVIVHPGAA